MVMSSLSANSLPASTTSAWETVRAQLKTQLGDATFASWLEPVILYQAGASHIILAAPTRFLREWVMANYQAEILRLWKVQDPNLLELDIVVRSSTLQRIADAGAEHMEASPANQNSAYDSTRSDPAVSIDYEGRQVSAPLDPRFTFERFVTGPSNELACAASRRVAQSTGITPGCNPLFLHSGVGLGKTHLMHAIAWEMRQRHPERKVIILSAEKFMYQFIRALRSKEALAFKELFRSVDVLMIDDVQFISGKDSTQEEFFHTFNALVDQGKQLIISCDRSPSALEGIEERVRSRLGGGLVIDIHQSSYELRLQILRSKMERMPDADIPLDVLDFLARRITSNIRELEGALNRIVAHATLVGRAITLDFTQDVLADLLRANDRRITIEEIQKQVAAHFNIKLADMHSARRSRMVARPRQIAMYLAKKLTTKSLPDIGRKFGGKDHTTVMHAVKRIDELSAADSEFAQEVGRLMRLVQCG